MKYLVVDMTNLLYRTFFAHTSESAETIAGLAMHSGLITLNKYYRNLKPNKIIACFDRDSWRKEYTASEKAITPKPYKGNRRQSMTQTEAAKYEIFCDHLNQFEVLLRDHTAVITLAWKGLEADDLIAGSIQTLQITDPGCECIIISGDKDMIQLLKHPNVKLIDPASGKERTLDDWDGDAELFMFEKCIRGDTGDNVQSARPFIKKTRIMKCYEDSFERANLMNEKWKDSEGKEYVVKQLFKENEILMDLEKQPEDIQQTIIETVLRGLDNPGQFNYFYFSKFIGKHKLEKVKEQSTTFAKLLS